MDLVTIAAHYSLNIMQSVLLSSTFTPLLHFFSLTQIFKSNFCVHCITLMHGAVQDMSSLAPSIPQLATTSHTMQ